VSARDQVIEYLKANPGEQRTADISASCECSQAAVYTALSGLAATGEITRVATGRYALTGGAKAREAETKPARRETKVPDPDPPLDPNSEEHAVNDHPIEMPEQLQMGIWSTGELTLARGEMQILLQPAEVREMVQFLDRVGAVSAAAADGAA